MEEEEIIELKQTYNSLKNLAPLYDVKDLLAWLIDRNPDIDFEEEEEF